MALSCAMPVTYKSSTPATHKPLSSFLDLYEHMTIKREDTSSSTSSSPYEDSTSSSEYDHNMTIHYKHALVKTEMEDDDTSEIGELTSWTKKHPERWSTDEVLDWIYFVVDKMDLDGSKVCGEAYQTISGSKLCRMSRQDFMASDPFYGSKLYDVFRDLINGATVREPKSMDQACSTTLESINQSHRFQRNHQHQGNPSVNNNCYNTNSGSSKNTNTNTTTINNNINIRGRKEAPSGFDLDFRSNSNSPNLLVYNQDDNDVKVDLGTLGVYPISTDFEFLASRDDGVFPSASSSCSTTTSASALSSTSSSLSPAMSSLPSSPFSFFNSVSENRHHHHHHHHYHHPNNSSFNNSQSGCYFNGQQKQQQHRQQLLPSHQQHQQHHQHQQQQNYHSLQPISVSSLPQLSPIIQSLPSLQQTYLHSNQRVSFNNGSTNHTTHQNKQYSVHSPSTTYSSFVSSSTPSTTASPSHSTSSSSSPSPSSSPSLEMSVSSTNISSSSPSSTSMPSSSSSKFSAIQTTCDSLMKSSPLTSSLSSIHLSTPSSSSSSSAALSVSTMSSVTTSSLFSSPVVDISSSELMEVTDSDYISDDDLFGSCSVQISEDVTMKTPPSTSKNVMNAPSSLDRKRTGRKNKTTQGNKGNHLWEFVRDLLQDPAYNPRLLKWEDKENGVFRFVQSEAVAQLWGEKKKNPMMTYEKLSRAMRFCRSSGYFDNVPKNGKFPKKLCFMFGVKAHGWRT